MAVICNMENYYELFDLPNFSSFHDVKSRYQEFAKEYHPDKLLGKSSCLTKEESTQFLVKINRAWEVLKNPYQKVIYDEQLKQLEVERTYTVNDSVSISNFQEYCIDGANIFSYSCRCGGDYELTKSEFANVNESIIANCSYCSLCIEVLF